MCYECLYSLGFGVYDQITIGSQPKVKGVKVKTLGPVDVKIIRSKTFNFGIDNWSKFANHGPNWTKLGRNPIELIVLEPLEGVPEPNLDHNGPKIKKLSTKNLK